MRVVLPDVPQERVVPLAVLTALRDIDPRFTMIHLSGNRWVTGYLSDDPRHLVQGRISLENTRRAVGALEAKRAQLPPSTRQRCRDRLTIARFKACGAIGCRVYESRHPDSAIVEQVRRDDFYHRHTTEAEFWRQCDAIQETAERERIADLTDHARANDVWRYSNTLSHTPGIATTASLPTPRSSARTLHRIAAAS